MGYFVPAERIFNGLIAVEESATPARVGLGLVKLERGLYQEATQHFRHALQHGSYSLQVKLGLVASFIASGERARARTILAEISKAGEINERLDPEIKRLFEAFVIRCSE
jgi:hypothetical protein